MATCHNQLMKTTYAIAPRGHVYWIERIGQDGSRTFLERFPTEEMAVQRLRTIQQWVDTVERRESGQPLPPRRAPV